MPNPFANALPVPDNTPEGWTDAAFHAALRFGLVAVIETHNRIMRVLWHNLRGLTPVQAAARLGTAGAQVMELAAATWTIAATIVAAQGAELADVVAMLEKPPAGFTYHVDGDGRLVVVPPPFPPPPDEPETPAP